MSQRDAVLGEVVTLPDPAGGQVRTMEVGPTGRTSSLPGAARHPGAWGCATHHQRFSDIATGASHLMVTAGTPVSGDTEHVLVWDCDEHGPEVP